MFNKIVVGVDGRQGGRDAIELARLLARPGATITLAHVHGSYRHPERAVEPESVWAERSEDLLEVERAAAGIDATVA
jgi:nucleotide-binding universal stress UspA family protein